MHFSSIFAPARAILPATLTFRQSHIALAWLSGGALIILGLMLSHAALSAIAMTAGAGIVLMALIANIVRRILVAVYARDIDHARQLLDTSPTACVMTDLKSGLIFWANAAAVERLDVTTGSPIGHVFTGLSADPDALAARLQDRALDEGAARHENATELESRRYKITPISVYAALWQIDVTDLSDARDTLPLDVAQISADGQISYASPSLRPVIAGLDQTASLFARDNLPGFGQVAQFTTDPASGVQSYLRLRPTQADEDTLLFMPVEGLVPLGTDSSIAQPNALETMPVAVIHIRPDGTLTYLNQEARQLLRVNGASRAVLSDMLEGLGRPVMEWLADVVHGRLARSTEVLRLNRDDCETYLKVVLTKTRDHPGDDVVAVLSDVTELKSLEAKFTQSQKMQAIGQLAGGVAHDFNNLLTAISGHCDLLLLRHDRSDLDYPDLMQIQQNTNRAAALVRQLLALSRQQTLKFVTLDLPETMSDVIHLLNRLVGEKITLTLRHGEDVAPIRSDKRQFEQVLMNLVVNARDAMPMGGEIRIETEAMSLPTGFIRDGVHLPAGDYTLIHITDDGTGIPQNLLEKVFDPFFTTKKQGEGTGLGLSTVYGIVKQSGGYIFVESEEGVGTRFTLYFAAQEEAQVHVPAAARDQVQAPTFKGQRALILLVEDEAPVRSFAARALELQGHRVIEADCGEAALEILENINIRPDFFVSDVIMPGLDGPSWVAQVRDRFPLTPVLFMSGYSEDSRVAAQARISNATFLGKPFSLAEFISTVNRQLQQHSEAA
ncbi:MAG: response regulator [Rhodobacteraceae bacterium]|nr:MAG: response regulator [Paracoccaceae bacterium]